MSDVQAIAVEVVYALPEQQKLIELLVQPGTTAFQAVEQSGITRFFPNLDIEEAPLGIFGQTLGTKGLPPARQYILRQGDRVEIYRPLKADPKEARRRRAAKSSEQPSAENE